MFQNYTTASFIVGMETVNNPFPPEVCLHIYTAGSKLDKDSFTGTRIFREHYTNHLSRGSERITIDWDVETFKVAFTHLRFRTFLSEKFIIFSDFQTMILVIDNSCQSPIFASKVNSRSLLLKLHENQKMVILQ
ncbi:hypothetical protein TNCV_2743461 [Trichonephila clavipes]|nr:hypothetical protein TNCV_2743461 [Trichonephila clavipes]